MKPVLDYDFTEYVSDAALPIPDNATNSSSGNNTGLYMLSNCTNDYCMNDEDYIALVEKYIFPTPVEWIFITLHCIVFIVGLVGNVLVCLAVYRNQNMRTVTNYFIVNLALADFMVILVCLPPTVLWDVTETWFFGSVLCKVVLYIQVRKKLKYIYIYLFRSFWLYFHFPSPHIVCLANKKSRECLWGLSKTELPQNHMAPLYNLENNNTTPPSSRRPFHQ